MKELEINNLLDTDKTIAKRIFDDKEFPWNAFPDLKDFILELGKTLPEDEYTHPSEDVWISKSAKVFPTAHIAGPCIIDHEAEVRHCAFIRGSAIVGKNTVVGNSTELKNSILFVKHDCESHAYTILNFVIVIQIIYACYYKSFTHTGAYLCYIHSKEQEKV